MSQVQKNSFGLSNEQLRHIDEVLQKLEKGAQINKSDVAELVKFDEVCQMQAKNLRGYGSPTTVRATLNMALAMLKKSGVENEQLGLLRFRRWSMYVAGRRGRAGCWGEKVFLESCSELAAKLIEMRLTGLALINYLEGVVCYRD